MSSTKLLIRVLIVCGLMCAIMAYYFINVIGLEFQATVRELDKETEILGDSGDDQYIAYESSSQEIIKNNYDENTYYFLDESRLDSDLLTQLFEGIVNFERDITFHLPDNLNVDDVVESLFTIIQETHYANIISNVEWSYQGNQGVMTVHYKDDWVDEFNRPSLWCKASVKIFLGMREATKKKYASRMTM